jgi:mannose-6-phosphate isomerase-like protein (cupin superfamily)
MKPLRRVVTGLDASGQSCVLIDGPAKPVIWSTEETPADNSSTKDAGGGAFRFPESGSLFVFSDIPPGGNIQMHATDTLDYIVILSGEVVFITETGETVLRAADALVDRGHMHAWRNESDEPCRIMNVLLPARPVGKGATVSGKLHSGNRWWRFFKKTVKTVLRPGVRSK